MFKQAYGHAAASGRSRGAGLSDLFWYWLSPGAHVHQEHIEAGPRYDDVAETTRRIVSVSKEYAQVLAADCMRRALQRMPRGGMRFVRLRDLMMPVWADFYHELIFGEPCPPRVRALIVENATDTLEALKGLRLRHMARRAELTAYLAGRLDAGTITAPLPASLSREEQVFYFQGVYFSTALIQMSEAMSHLILALAQNPKVQDRLSTQLNDVHFFDDVIAESLRMFPLFGVAHRITSDAITLDDDTVLAKGSVLCFNYLDYQKSGFEDSGTFKPERWRNLTARDATYIPFGVTGNRPCPARALALITMRAAAAEFIREYVCYSTASHLRSLPNRGPCLLMRRGDESRPVMQRALLAWMKLRDRWADVWRSCVQLLLGTIMVLDARRLRLAHDYFASDPDEIESAGPAEGRGKCPFHS